MIIPFSCDTSVALGSATFDGSTLLAKNSDRSPNEAQPLIHVPGQRHSTGSTAKCQYLEIPQVEQTWELIGSRPCWLWGFEMGVNEWGVAIGNEAVHTREPSEEIALIGMDLVRLGLERSTTADEATTVICELVERYGQGGSCEEHSFRTYHNSFIIADSTRAWIVETAGHYFAAKKVEDRAAIGNLLTIGESWDRASERLVEHAVDSGWATNPFSFSESYRNPDRDISTGTCRLDRACSILGGYQEPITVQDMIAVLSDHGDRDLPVQAEPLPTLCMHACPGYMGETAASMVAHLKPGKSQELTSTVWTAFGSPCLSVFRPVYPFAVGLPPELNIGASTYSADSPWWTFERLQRIAAAEPSLAPEIRSALGVLQSAIFTETAQIELEAARSITRGDNDAARSLLRSHVDRTTQQALDLAGTLITQHGESSSQSSYPVMTGFWDEINREARLLVPA